MESTAVFCWITQRSACGVFEPDCADFCGEIRRVLQSTGYCGEIAERALRRNSQTSAAKPADLCIRETQCPKMVIFRPVAARGPAGGGWGGPSDRDRPGPLVPSGGRGTPPATLVCARGVPGKVETVFRPPCILYQVGGLTSYSYGTFCDAVAQKLSPSCHAPPS